MKIRTFSLTMLALLFTILPGCELIEGAFKAGVWVTVIAIALVITIIVLILMSVGKQQVKKSPAGFKKTDPVRVDV